MGTIRGGNIPRLFVGPNHLQWATWFLMNYDNANLIIIIYILEHNKFFRSKCELFQHLSELISRYLIMRLEELRSLS